MIFFRYFLIFISLFQKQTILHAGNESFYKFYEEQAQALEVSNDQLRSQSDISQYVPHYRLSKEDRFKLHREFVKKRIFDKKNEEGAQHPDLTDEAVLFMQNQAAFIEYFVKFLEDWHKVEFYSVLASRAIDISRGKVSTEFPMGRPEISPELRLRNQQFVSNLNNQHFERYEPILEYFLEIERASKTKQPFTSWENFLDTNPGLKQITIKYG